MRYLLLLLALLNCSLVLAQTTPVPAAPEASASLVPLAVPDTAAAIHRLFAGKRHERNVVVGGTLALGGGLFFGATRAYSLDSGLRLFTGSLLTVPVSLAELLLYHKYSRRREEQALAAWQAHQLPRSLQKRLKGRYFQPAAPALALQP